MDISPEILGLIDEVRNDKTRGASQLARRAAEVLKIAAERSRVESPGQFWREQRAVGERLMSARPAMAPIFNIVSGLLDAIAGSAETADLNTIRRLTATRANEAIEASLQAVAQIAEHGSQLIADGDRIMTHSYSSTVAAALKEAFTEHRDIEVTATRSGAGRSGEKTARELGLYGIPVVFIDDTAAGLYMSAASKVVVGADRICADGKLVNGIGTYQLALAADKAGVPVYVLCETLKFDPRVRGDEVDLEGGEVVETSELPPQVRVGNPSFDITPLELVTGVVTENGLLTPEEVGGYLQRLSVKCD